MVMQRFAILLAAVMAVTIAAGCDYEKKRGDTFAIVESPGISGHIVPVRYSLVGTELCEVRFYYTLDGQFWYPATRGYGGEGEIGAVASPTGTEHIWHWDSLADIGTALSLNVMIRVSPETRGKAFDGWSPVFIVNNTVNSRPTAVILGTTGSSGNVIVDCCVSDNEADAVTAKLQFSVDGGANFFDARLAQGVGADEPVRLDSSCFVSDLNDESEQLSNWNVTGVVLGVSTDSRWKVSVSLTDTGGTRQVSLYSDFVGGALIAQGTLAGDGTVTLAEQSSSGVSGSVDVA
jgi:hypothetical protein